MTTVGRGRPCSSSAASERGSSTSTWSATPSSPRRRLRGSASSTRRDTGAPGPAGVAGASGRRRCRRPWRRLRRPRLIAQADQAVPARAAHCVPSDVDPGHPRPDPRDDLVADRPRRRGPVLGRGLRASRRGRRGRPRRRVARAVAGRGRRRTGPCRPARRPVWRTPADGRPGRRWWRGAGCRRRSRAAPGRATVSRGGGTRARSDTPCPAGTAFSPPGRDERHRRASARTPRGRPGPAPARARRRRCRGGRGRSGRDGLVKGGGRVGQVAYLERAAGRLGGAGPPPRTPRAACRTVGWSGSSA